MNDILQSIYKKDVNNEHTLGILLIDKQNFNRTHFNINDTIVIVILNMNEKFIHTEQYQIEDNKIILHRISIDQLREWLLLGADRKVLEWLYIGRVIFQQNHFIDELKKELNVYPMYDRKVRIGIEFAKLINKYIEGKSFFEKENYLDAYSHMIDSLHHLARLAVIENGYHPEVTVWNQVKQIEPEVYKLYEELVTSNESLPKRLELLFLASEYFIHSNTPDWTNHITDILSERQDWTYEKISTHKELSWYSCDLGVLIEYLIERNFLEVTKKETDHKDMFVCLYKVNHSYI